MIASLLLIIASAPVGALSASMDASLAAGLAVTIDRIPEPVAVDGVWMTVQRVTGSGVPELARRIEARWRSQGSQVKEQQQGRWKVRSRLQGVMSEVMQWHSDTGGSELLVSVLDVQAPVRPLPSMGLTLPAGCIWGRSISGISGTQSFLQRTARCPHSIQPLSLQLRHSLPTQGWRVRWATDSGLQVERAGGEGFISLSTQAGDRATWVTWLRLESNP
jgi:hypothetical protein